MARRIYSSGGIKSDWQIEDQRLSLTVLFPKWKKWTHACTHSPLEIITGLKARISELETERDNEGPHGPYNEG